MFENSSSNTKSKTFFQRKAKLQNQLQHCCKTIIALVYRKITEQFNGQLVRFYQVVVYYNLKYTQRQTKRFAILNIKKGNLNSIMHTMETSS